MPTQVVALGPELAIPGEVNARCTILQEVEVIGALEVSPVFFEHGFGTAIGFYIRDGSDLHG